MNDPITLKRDRYPFPHCAHAWIFSWYLLLVYTRYYSKLLLFYVQEILPCSLTRSTTTDFRISQYSSTHIFYQVFSIPGIIFSRGCQAFHIIYHINTSYQKLPFGSGDYPDTLFFHQALNYVSNSSYPVTCFVSKPSRITLGSIVHHLTRVTKCYLSTLYFVYQVYFTVRIGILQICTHLVHIYVVYTYSSIRGTPVPYDMWYLLLGNFLVYVRQTYTGTCYLILIAGMINLCLRELSN